MSVPEELIARAQAGDIQAKEQLITENAGLIWAVARRFQGRGTELEDLYQLGCLGFLKAVRGFDFAYGTCFSTYAVPKIAGEIRRYLRDSGSLKVSRSIREQAISLYRARERLRNENGEEPTLSALAEHTGLTVEDIARIDLACDEPESLQAEFGDGLTLEGTLGGDAPEEQLVERLALEEAIARSKARDARRMAEIERRKLEQRG